MEEDEQDDFADIYANAASTTAIQETAADEVNSHKRKHDVEDYDLDEGDNFYADKRQKTVSPTLAPSTRDISLPPELWQAISQHLTPRTLATLLRVNHMFLNCLTSEDAPNTKGCPTTSRQPMESNEVWLSSRRLYYPSLPRSSPACDERALWKLLRAENCQFCAKQATSRPDTSNPWTAGPGSDGVSIVWPFGVRSCGPCLRQRVQSDSSLMFSDYSALLAAAPFAFMTTTDHLVSPTVFRSRAEGQASLEVNKVFYIPMLVEMQSALHRARDRHPQAAGELYSRLRAERPQKLESAEMWSQWEGEGGLEKLRAQSFEPEVNSVTRALREGSITSGLAQATGSNDERSSSPPYSPQLGETPETGSTPAANGSQRSSSITQSKMMFSGPRIVPSRNVTSVRQAKLIRRAEIERRCSELDPPISPELLNHMDSFQAAMQIGAPLNDAGWDMLKPRLLAQREIAQQREDDRLAVIDAGRVDAEGTNLKNMDPQQLKERWDVLQKPLRTRLAGYVDEIVHSSWADGRAINADTSPRFASDALVYVRNRFAAEVPKFTGINTSGTKLVLENMKWVYDNKIKPLAEPHRRDLFLCAGCGDKAKYFAFDSIIQHYAAKHTSTYSAGTVVVAWQEAIWPEQPPFQTFPDPDSRRKEQQTPFPKQQAIAAHPQGPLYGPQPIHAPTPGFYSGGHMTSPPPFAQSYGQFASPDHSRSQQPFQPSASPAYQQQPGFAPPGPPGPYGATSPFDPRGFFPGPSPQTPASAHGGWGVPPFSSHPPTYAPSPAQGAPTFLQMQSDAVSNIAREVWDSLFIIKQIHPSVRMYVLIHRVVSRFKTRFSNEPNLDLFTQCLINHHLMRPMKDANGLACKTCVVNNESHEESHSQAFHLSSGERKLYPFHSLLLHFKNVHVEHALALENAQTHEVAEKLHRLDWKEDMIELPEEHIIANYRTAPSMDRAKYEILKEAFPNLPDFVEQDVPQAQAMPIAMQGSAHARNVSAGYPAPSPVYGYQPMDISPTTDEPFIKIEPGTTFASSQGQRYSPSRADETPRPRDDEYDPQRPALHSSRLPQEPRNPGSGTNYNQPHGNHPNYQSRDYRSAPSRQSYGHRSPVETAPSPGQRTTDPGLTALLQNLTAQQAAQNAAADSGARSAKEQADTFLRDFVPTSESHDRAAPSQTPMMQPPQYSDYGSSRRAYEHNPPHDPFHVQSRRTSSISGSYDNRPTYIGPEQQHQQSQYHAQFAGYAEEPVEYVYVRRRDTDSYQQPYQGYR